MAAAAEGHLGLSGSSGLSQAHAEETTAYEAFLQRLYGRRGRRPPEGFLRGSRRWRAQKAEASPGHECEGSPHDVAATGSSCAAPLRQLSGEQGDAPANGIAEADCAGGAEAAWAKAAADAFRCEVELEEEILARARREPWELDGILGTAVLVQCRGLPAASETGQAFFADAFNSVLLQLLKDAAGESPSSAVGEGVERTLHPIGALMGHCLMHYTFPHSASCHFQAFIDVLARPKDSLRSLLEDWLRLDRAAKASQVEDIVKKFTARLQDLLLHVRRALESLRAPEHEVAEHFKALVGLASLVGLPCGWTLPEVEQDAQWTTVRCLLPAPCEFAVALRRGLRASELKELLVQRLGFAERARVLREEGSDVPVDDDEVIAVSGGTVIVDQAPPASSFPNVAVWRVQDPVFKVTTLSATRLLAELRAIYAEPEFFRDYHQLRLEGQGQHVEKAIGVQSRVLPKYGYEGSRRGVIEMRKQVSTLAENDRALNKTLKDIHGLLDAHRPMPSMPVTRAMEAARFAPEDVAGWSAHLANEGYAVVAGVADGGQVQEAYRLLWDFLERADASRHVSRRDVRSWLDSGERGSGWPAGDDGIIGGRGVGQCQAMWYLRGLPKLRRVFSEIWRTEHLVASFDGAGVFRPYGHDDSWRTRKKNWFHLDQAHYKRGLHCVQGLVNLKDATEETGGLVVVPRSHRFHNDVMRRYNGIDALEDFVRIDITDPVLVEGNVGPVMVAARAGDLVIWDSRTVHCNTAPLRENRQLLAGDDLIRAVAYICMTPAAWCSFDVLRQRRQGVEVGATTKHWPHEYHPKSIPRTWSPEFALSDEHWSLVCPGGRQEPLPQDLNGALRPGSISCVPARRFKVAAESSPLRSAATTKWAKPLCALRGGEAVEGYVMGEWLRLTAWPQEMGRPSQSTEWGAEEDVWAQLSDFEPC